MISAGFVWCGYTVCNIYRNRRHGGKERPASTFALHFLTQKSLALAVWSQPCRMHANSFEGCLSGVIETYRKKVTTRFISALPKCEHKNVNTFEHVRFDRKSALL